jgi:sugar O-acyltransferase (sialic acid O-acetyltransferase NeuD family)
MHPKTDIILYGGGGHCISVIDVIETGNQFRIAGIVDMAEKVGQKVSGYEIIGADADLPKLVKEYSNWCITIGQIKGAVKRMEFYQTLKNLGAVLPVIISPLAHISARAQVGESTVVMHQALINAGAVVGINNIINTRALIEHEVQVGNHCHISTSAVLNGQVKLGDECFIGSKSVVRNNITIGSRAVVGAGSVVISDLNDDQTVAGNPARKI